MNIHILGKNLFQEIRQELKSIAISVRDMKNILKDNSNKSLISVFQNLQGLLKFFLFINKILENAIKLIGVLKDFNEKENEEYQKKLDLGLKKILFYV